MPSHMLKFAANINITFYIQGNQSLTGKYIMFGLFIYKSFIFICYVFDWQIFDAENVCSPYKQFCRNLLESLLRDVSYKDQQSFVSEI